MRPGPGKTATEDVSSLQSIGDTDAFLIVASGVHTEQGTYTVIVASTVQVQADSVATVAWFLLGATPLLLIVVGFSVWLLVGRSLRQVERIRGQVARINASRLSERVEVPATNDEIHRLALTMNTMLDRLQASDGEQRRFVSDASHELRSPLATISAGLEIAAADPSGETWHELQGMLSGETARMRYDSPAAFPEPARHHSQPHPRPGHRRPTPAGTGAAQRPGQRRPPRTVLHHH